MASRLATIRTSADAIILNEIVTSLLNKDLKNQMKCSVEKMTRCAHFVCSDGITPLNPLLGVMTALIYVFLEESPLANFNRVDECRALVVDYLTSPQKLHLMATACLYSFTSFDQRFWSSLSMHYAEKSSHMIECIVNEGLNPSQRYNGLIFQRQVGNIYLMGHPSMQQLEDFRKQFINVPDNVDIFQSFFEAGVVPEVTSTEGAGLELAFSNFQGMFSQEQMTLLPGLLREGNDLPALARLFNAANLEDGMMLNSTIYIINFVLAS